MKTSTLIKAGLLMLSMSVLPVAHAAPAATPAPAQQQLTRGVNINTADAATIATSLSGIGQRKAEAIVAYRNEHGPFKSIDDLVNVKGIGAKTLERLREMISL